MTEFECFVCGGVVGDPEKVDVYLTSIVLNGELMAGLLCADCGPGYVDENGDIPLHLTPQKVQLLRKTEIM